MAADVRGAIRDAARHSGREYCHTRCFYAVLAVLVLFAAAFGITGIYAMAVGGRSNNGAAVAGVVGCIVVLMIVVGWIRLESKRERLSRTERESIQQRLDQ
jgi:uncharacterized membrane protein